MLASVQTCLKFCPTSMLALFEQAFINLHVNRRILKSDVINADILAVITPLNLHMCSFRFTNMLCTK